MSKPARLSYLVMTLLLVLVGWLHLATLLLPGLFGYFALSLFDFRGHKIIALSLYVALVVAMGLGLFHFSRQAYKVLPRIIDTSIPAVVEFAEKQNIELPFTDYASLKSLAIAEAKERFVNVGQYTRQAVLRLVLIVIGLVVAAGIFLNAGIVIEGDPHAKKDSLYSQVGLELGRRFQNFYQSFAIVMGAQIVISAINTALTAVFLLASGFPYVTEILVLTFLCGLLPIIGNILSNTLIICVGFTVSPQLALMALAFLVVIHKLEYFLNSKIIGHRIRNPMWLTLIGLVLGEKLMGIPGMILAPVVLHYIKVESANFKAAANVPASQGAPTESIN